MLLLLLLACAIQAVTSMNWPGCAGCSLLCISRRIVHPVGSRQFFQSLYMHVTRVEVSKQGTVGVTCTVALLAVTLSSQSMAVQQLLYFVMHLM
jgi:hypothetical protein